MVRVWDSSEPCEGQRCRKLGILASLPKLLKKHIIGSSRRPQKNQDQSFRPHMTQSGSVCSFNNKETGKTGIPALCRNNSKAALILAKKLLVDP